MRPTPLRPSIDEVPTDREVMAALDVIRRSLLARAAPPSPSGPPGERLLSLQAVAERLGVSKRSARRLVDAGELSSQLVLRRRMVRQADLDAFIEGGS